MEILQEIGSYAGLAAVLGLAILSALYFSQARDVKRLREWAGRAPERAPEPPVAVRPAARPVPRAPGQPLPAAQRPIASATAAVGATPATAVGPAAATPAALRAAQAARTAEKADDEAESDEDTPGTTPGTLSQDTVVHPPPTAPGNDEDDLADADADADDDDADDWDETGDHAIPAPEEHWDDDDDHPDDDDPDDDPAPAPAVVPRRPAPSLPPRPAPVGATASSSILPPYAESKPGAGPVGRGGMFSSRRRAFGIAAGVVLVLAIVVFAATRLLGGSDSGTTKQPNGNVATTTPKGGSTGKTATTPKPKGVAPSSVRVAVLNGTTVPGLAAQIGDSIQKQGFKLGTVTNFNDQQRAESVVLYAPGAEREAAEVGRRLKISQREPIDAASQSVAGDATVVVVTGRDKTQ